MNEPVVTSSINFYGSVILPNVSGGSKTDYPHDDSLHPSMLPLLIVSN